MKKILTAALCLTVPGLLFLNAWQGYRFNALSDQVASLEKEQKVLLEANRDIIGQIAFESSPERVAEKAAGLGLVPAGPDTVTRLQAGPAGAPAAAGGPGQ
jgi:ABC-type phosphate transport system auxiliary subunit